MIVAIGMCVCVCVAMVAPALFHMYTCDDLLQSDFTAVLMHCCKASRAVVDCKEGTLVAVCFGTALLPLHQLQALGARQSLWRW